MLTKDYSRKNNQCPLRPPPGGLFLCRKKPRVTAGRFAPASVKAGVGKEQVTPSAREVMLGKSAASVSQFLLLVKILSATVVDKTPVRSTLNLWMGNRAFRKPPRKST